MIMEYLYHLANASLTLRIVEFLHSNPVLPLEFVTIIHHMEGWIVRIKMKRPLNAKTDGDFRALMLELGVAYQPTPLMQQALQALAMGQPALQVMQDYQVAVVSHGPPAQTEIEAFRHHFIQGLGYCPANLA